MDDSPKWVVATVRAIDRLSSLTGAMVAILIIPLVGGVTYEVISRYLFNAPTVWAYDTTYMLYGAHFMLGAAYTLLKGAHIRTDIFYQNWSLRTKGLVDASLYLLFFFPGMILFFVMGWQEAYHSLAIGELSEATPWRPPLYPFKFVIPVTALLILIQGISEFLKSVHAVRKGSPLVV
jgi:TRAP-type mannitol/chloroaromatic compound transport system permease small subunit